MYKVLTGIAGSHCVVAKLDSQGNVTETYLDARSWSQRRTNIEIVRAGFVKYDELTLNEDAPARIVELMRKGLTATNRSRA